MLHIKILRGLAVGTLMLAAGISPAIADGAIEDLDKTGVEDLDEAGVEVLDEIGVEVLNVDVVVTDKKGRPVRGLSREDFVLRVDGREVPIDNFYAIADQDLAEGLTPADSLVESSSSDEPLHLVVYLDNFYLVPGGRRRVLEDLPDFFDRHIAAGARILLAARDTEIRLLTPFTDDPEELRAALAKAVELPTQGIRRRQERESVLRDIRDTYEICLVAALADPCRDCFGGMRAAARFYGLSVEHHKQASLASLEALVGALGTLDGRKALLHVSDGIQERSGLDAIHYVGEICPEREADLRGDLLRFDSVADLNAVVARANASRVTIFAMEAAGLRQVSAVSVAHADPEFLPSSRNDQIRVANLQSTLFFLSNETGGRAVLNANRFDSDLRKISSELAEYYSLGFQADHPGGGESHRISVEVRKPKLQLRYRRSVLHRGADQLLADRTMGAALFGGGANPLAAEAVTGQLSPGSEGRTAVPVEIRLPLSKITRLSEGNSEPGRLTLVVAAPAGDAGDGTAVRKQELSVTWPDGELADLDYHVGVHVELPPGGHHLGIGIWDPLAAHGSFLSVPVTVEGGAP